MALNMRDNARLKRRDVIHTFGQTDATELVFKDLALAIDLQVCYPNPLASHFLNTGRTTELSDLFYRHLLETEMYIGPEILITLCVVFLVS